MRKMPNSNGFTLIELMVVLMILITVGGILLSILISVLRSTVKTNSLNELRQIGTYTISQISKSLRDSKSFDGISADGVAYVPNCVSASPLAGTPSPTPSDYKYIKFTAFDNTEIIYSCAATTIASNGASLLNTQAVNLTSCSFTCSQNTILDPPTIGINFSLVKNTPTGTILHERTASASAVPFQTSITIRNVNR